MIAATSVRGRSSARLSESAVRLLTAAAVTAVAALTTAQPAAAQRDREIHGDRGGRIFGYTCRAGRVLVGLKGSAGVWLDNVQAICARVDAAGDWTEAAPEGPSFGNARPQDQQVQCPQNYGVVGAAISMNDDHPYVGMIRLTCVELVNRQDGGSATLELRGSGNLAGYDGSIGVAGSPGGDIAGFSLCEDGYGSGIRGRAGEHVSAFGLICGRAGRPQGPAPVANAPAAAPLLDPAFAPLINSESSFQTFNFPDRFIRHANWLGFVEPSGGNYGSITFRMVPGLGGSCVSLESKDHPGHFLRHQNWRIKLSALNSDPNMRADATFCPAPGLASTTGISFEAVSAPGHFIRHRNFELWLDRPDGSDQFRKDATFLAAPPGGAPLGVR